APIIHQVRTDANGAWADAVTALDFANTEYGSEWRIETHFDGDGLRLPADSAPCPRQGHYP
ncbi:MAG: hypothetical protein ACRDKE_08855, partial [Solirubrobacterales bacterium]